MCSNREKALYLRLLLDELRQLIAGWRLNKERAPKAEAARAR